MRVVTTAISVEDAQANTQSPEALMATDIPASILDMVALCHFAAVANHWWHDKDGKPIERNFGECIALIHSEISEAMEGGRKDKRDEHLPHYSSVTVELADALIRIFDLVGALNLDLGEAFLAKFIYNQQRADHKIANREAEGGKQF